MSRIESNSQNIFSLYVAAVTSCENRELHLIGFRETTATLNQHLLSFRKGIGLAPLPSLKSSYKQSLVDKVEILETQHSNSKLIFISWISSNLHFVSVKWKSSSLKLNYVITCVTSIVKWCSSNEFPITNGALRFFTRV